MLEVADKFGFKFDTVQMPLNLMDVHYRSFAKEVVPVLVGRHIGVLGMKSMANGILLKSNTVTPIECLHYALNLPTSVVITGIDSMEILDQAFIAARTFHPLSNQELDELFAKTASAASTGRFEPFKTTSIFDSTAYNPQWLGEEPPEVRELIDLDSLKAGSSMPPQTGQGRGRPALTMKLSCPIICSHPLRIVLMYGPPVRFWP